jgi:hypothetical protein
MITHDDLNKELGGSMTGTRMHEGFEGKQAITNLRNEYPRIHEYTGTRSK